jgi:hypothetical protein
VNAYLQSVRDEDHNHPDLKRKDTYIAIYRATTPSGGTT